MPPRRSKRTKAPKPVEEEPMEKDDKEFTIEDEEKSENESGNEESVADDSKSEISEPGPSAKTYYDYDPTIFQSAVRYRTHSDIVANTIIRSEANGVDRYEIGKHLSLNSKTKSGNRRVSALIQQLAKTYPDRISHYQKMEGKYRILRYFYKEGEAIPSSFLELLEKLEELLGHDFPYSCSDVVKFPGKNLSALRISDITLRRFFFILEFLREEGVIVLIWRLSRHIAKKESDLGYQFAIDKKSVMKCLYALEQKQIIRVLKLDNSEPKKESDDDSTPGDTESPNQISIVVPYEINDPQDQRINDAVKRVRQELNTEGRIFPTGQFASTKQNATKTSATRTKRINKKKAKVEHGAYEDNLMTVEERYKHMRYSFDSTRVKSDSNESGESSDNEGENSDFDYGHQTAKMIRCAVLHEFIYHTVHEMEFDKNSPSLYDRFPLDAYLPANTECTPTNELPEIDNKPDSPFRHVVRIPPFKDAKRGWFMVRDILQGMPLSIFVLLVKPKHPVEGVQELLDDPERRHIPLADLPISMRKHLFNRSSALAIEHLCLIMSAMGLMLCASPFENRVNVMGPHALFYFGKTTFFYDTSTSGRGYALVIPPITQYTRYDYSFDNMEKVHQYWNHLKAVCWSTSLGARHIPEGQENFKSDGRKYSQGNVDRTPFTVNYDEEVDLIEPVGTFDGCAGFDAQLFVHLQRNWEVRAPEKTTFTNWFLSRWQQTAARLSKYVSERVSRLESNWNSFISSFLPTDNELARKKKTELAPILNQKTMDSLSSTFRRHTVARKISSQPPSTKRKSSSKNANRTVDSITSLLATIERDKFKSSDSQQPSTSKSTPTTNGSPKRSPRKRGAKHVKEEPVEETMEANSDEETPKVRRTLGGKRKLDETDLESIKSSTNMRSRFSNNEYDMLVLIRSISYFLNPIHRFWLNPSVMRDIMHMYVPESRCKTVSSLLAASAREMLRPGRTAQLQYIVKTFTDDKKMIEIRDQLAVQCKTDEEKSAVFWKAFTTAHKLIFQENEETPDASVNDAEFRKYLNKRKMTISVAEPTASGFPRRSRKPQTLEDVQHFVAYNVVLSTLITEACRVSNISDGNAESSNAFRSDFLINSLSPAVLTETLEICRSDGLISRVRNTDSKAYLTKNQVTISVYFRHFFNHLYRKDLVDLLKEILLDPPQPALNPTDDDNPAALLRMLDFIESKDQRCELNLSRLTDLIDCSANITLDENGKEIKSATKNVRQLESASMQLEYININLPSNKHNSIIVPSREKIARIVCPIYGTTTCDEPILLQHQLSSKIQNHETLRDQISPTDAFNILNTIRMSEFNGVTFAELKRSTDLSENNLLQLLDVFASLCIAFPCGIEVKRYVSAEHSQAWLIKTDINRFSARPWTLPNGLVNWPILRWMSEAMLTTILLKSGITIEELVQLFSGVLSPILVQEILDFLGAIGCCSLRVEEFISQKVTSPFESDQRAIETSTYVVPVLNALNKFAVFFAGIPLPESLLHRDQAKA